MYKICIYIFLITPRIPNHRTEFLTVDLSTAPESLITVIRVGWKTFHETILIFFPLNTIFHLIIGIPKREKCNDVFDETNNIDCGGLRVMYPRRHHNCDFN